MRFLPLILLVCTITPTSAQQKPNSPTEGNGLLDYCSVVVAAADSPDSITSLSDARFTAQLEKLNWCEGYLQATQEAAMWKQIHLALIDSMGVTLSGPAKQKEAAFNMLQGACIPEKAPVIQLARVLVKWLREHPERLHESRSVLTKHAFEAAFPCPSNTPKKDSK